MSTLSALKATSESITAEQRRNSDRKRSILVLIHAYLIENGYFETLEKFSAETNGVCSKFEVADNIDLNMILTEYENYYEVRFDRKPKMIRKVNDGEESKGKRSVSDSKRQHSQVKKSIEPGMKSAVQTSMSSEDQSLDMNVQGVKFTGKKDADSGEAASEERTLRPPPQFHHDPEMKQLVAVVSREIYQHSPNIKFEDIIGLDNAKRLLKEAIQLPISYPSIFTGILRPWRGILLHGPPGVVRCQCKVLRTSLISFRGRHYWPKLWRQNVVRHSSAFQRRLWSANGEEILRSSSEFFSR